MGEICGLHSPTATKKYYDHFVRETFQREAVGIQFEMARGADLVAPVEFEALADGEVLACGVGLDFAGVGGRVVRRIVEEFAQHP